jgi:hypothetical protein
LNPDLTLFAYFCNKVSKIAEVTAANVTKVTITTAAPEVGKAPSYKASVPETASTEVTGVSWVQLFAGNCEIITLRLKGKTITVTVDNL